MASQNLLLFSVLCLVISYQRQQNWVDALQVTSPSDISDGDCFFPDFLDSFKISPGGYDALEATMNGAKCASLCEGFDFPFAGVVYSRYCLCSTLEDLKEVLQAMKSSGQNSVASPDVCTSGSGVRIFKTKGKP